MSLNNEEVKRLRDTATQMTEDLERQRLDVRMKWFDGIWYEILSKYAIDADDKGLWEVFLSSVTPKFRDVLLRALVIRFAMEETLACQIRLLEEYDDASYWFQ